MATSAFKSTTKRASISGSSSEDSSSAATRSLRRSRSLSRFSRPTAESVLDSNNGAPKGKFVNTARGSTTQFPEISLDDLALEFFSSSSSMNEKGRDAGAVEGKEREGRSVSRRGEIGRWASDTASSRRRGRSVSKTRDDVVSGSSASGAKNVISSDAPPRRRRSLSVARYQISDSEDLIRSFVVMDSHCCEMHRQIVICNLQEMFKAFQNLSEVDHSRNSSNRANVKASISGNSQMTLEPKATASSNRRLGRTQSHKDLSMLHDGYSSHSSALTDDESKDTRLVNNGFEKIIRAVYAQRKAEHPTEDVANRGLYEAMRKELRHAVQEIRSELNQAIGRNQTTLTYGDCLQSDNFDALQVILRQSLNRLVLLCCMKISPSRSAMVEKCKQDLLKEHRGRDISKVVKELPDSRTSTVAENPSRARKRSNDRNRMSKRLIEEAERYFEDFISNVEDTDISSFDGERSDGSSTLGGTIRGREAVTYKIPVRLSSTCGPVEMEGVILPWLQWETGDDASLSPNTNSHTQALHWDSEKDAGNCSKSDGGGWSRSSVPNYCLDDEYLKHGNNEQLLFEMYSERNRINSGGLLLCTAFHF
ncbi:hypothetical protein BUALT_Bualt07G0086000 [Buddleja alternifolia]|uniref:Uncharacterized protein n=1 Tax=Buddleja alternifolia TaxID=168488 RepID=A0AAV6XGZ9_9LAMI|nr:hypothetical protein BUALT_Bualt07G0086000 [Buddleja alternifolia]